MTTLDKIAGRRSWTPAIRVDFGSVEMTLEKLTHAEQKIAERGIDYSYGADFSGSWLDGVVKHIVNEIDENMKGDPKFMPTRKMNEAIEYLNMDCEETRKLFAKVQREKNKAIYDSMIQQVIFNPPATIVFWRDGSKTVVKCGENDIFDPEKGLAMAISKRAFGDNRDYYEIFAKWVGKYEYQQKKKEKK